MYENHDIFPEEDPARELPGETGIENNPGEVSTLNLPRWLDMLRCAEALEKLFPPGKGSRTEVDFIGEYAVGFVSLAADELLIADGSVFHAALKEANTFIFYTDADGKVRLDAFFANALIKLE